MRAWQLLMARMCETKLNWQPQIPRHIVRASASPGPEYHSGSEFGEVAEWSKAALC